MTHVGQVPMERFVIKFKGEVVARSNTPEDVPDVAKIHLHLGQDELFVVDSHGGVMLPYTKFLKHHKLQ